LITRKRVRPSEKCPLLLGLSGKQKAGKTTAANYIIQKYGGKIIAFADALKAELYDLNAIRGSDLGAFITYAKAQNVSIDFDEFPRANMNNPRREDKVAWINRFKDQFRTAMQIYGDYRRSQNPNYFIDRTSTAIEAAITAGEYVVVVDDVRYYTEVRALESVGFEICRIQASDEVRKKRGASGEEHATETELDNHYHALAAFNNMEPHALYKQLDGVVVAAINKAD
jgi:hypothetical protein